MCLAIPAEVVDLLPEGMARVSIEGVVKEVNVSLLDEVQVGEFVLLHVGFALSKIDAEEAHKTLDILRELGELAELSVAEMAG